MGNKPANLANQLLKTEPEIEFLPPTGLRCWKGSSHRPAVYVSLYIVEIATEDGQTN